MTSANKVYKILSNAEWNQLNNTGTFTGSPADLADGFIHLSNASQVAGTLAKHFAARSDLKLVQIDVAKISAGLKWEVSRNGELFPHLYSPLELDQITDHWDLPVDNQGEHELPEGLACP